jgi:hypothetical protein
MSTLSVCLAVYSRGTALLAHTVIIKLNRIQEGLQRERDWRGRYEIIYPDAGV